jgi:flagellar basal body rod protein FlgG
VKKFLLVMLAVVCLVSSRQIANAQATNAQTANASNAGINGKWHFVMDTPGGDREVDAEFTVDADGKVTGKYGITDVAGTYKDGKLDLNFQMTSEESGQTAALKLVAKLDETAALVGTWEFSEYNGTFKATRPKP